MDKALYYDLELSEWEVQLRYYVHVWPNMLKKDMKVK